MLYMFSYNILFYVFLLSFFFFNDTATTEIYTYGHTLSLHDALPICSAAPTAPGSRCRRSHSCSATPPRRSTRTSILPIRPSAPAGRSEEHTSELQSLMRISYAVFCLKKKKTSQRSAVRAKDTIQYIHTTTSDAPDRHNNNINK